MKTTSGQPHHHQHITNKRILKKNPIAILLLLLLSAGCVAFAANPSRKGPERLKARYYYLEGARMNALGRGTEAFEYFKKAYQLDSTYAEAASHYGVMRLGVRSDTLQSPTERKKSVKMIRRYVDAYPADVFEARKYAVITQYVDTVTESIRVLERLDSLLPADAETLGSLAGAYLSAGRPEKAIQALTRFETTQGKNPQVSLKKMQIFLEMADTVSAVDEATALVASNPRQPDFRILKGNLYEVIGNNDSTLFYYRQAEEMSPDNGAVKLALANYFKNTGDSVAYDNKTYEALLSEDFGLEDKLSILGEYISTLLNEKNETKRGDHLFEELIRQYPHEAEVLAFAARYSAAKGDYKEAEQQMGYALDQDSENEVFWGDLMRFQYADGRPADAMATFTRAESHITPPDGLRLMYAAAAAEEKDFGKAEEAYAVLIHGVKPGLPLSDSISDRTLLNDLTYENLQSLSVYYTMLGDMYYLAKDLPKTFRAYDNALFFFDANALTLNNYAYFLAENGGDLDKALSMSRRSLDQDPDNGTYLDTYAWILFKKKDFKEALEYQKKAMESARAEGEEPGAEYFHHLGDILFMNHEPEQALENWEKALKLDPENALLKKKVAHKTFFFE